MVVVFGYFYDTAHTEFYTYCHTRSLHGALPIALGSLAAEQRKSLGALADPHQGEAKIGFPRVALGIGRDQRLPHPPGQEGADEGVEDGAPHHVARNGEAAAVDHEDDEIGRANV